MEAHYVRVEIHVANGSHWMMQIRRGSDRKH